MRIQETIQIDAPAEKVWDILWNKYGQVCDWASTVNSSSDRKVLGNENGGRTCHSAWGEISEIVEHVDTERMTYRYRADGLPKMMKSAVNSFTVNKKSVNTSEVELDLNVELAIVPKILMSWMMVPKMKKDVLQTLVDLKYFAETDMQTEIKTKSDLKFNKKRLKKVS
ncbi:SRPBCC family protein [Maribacter sp. 2-571]|uniref:SRPBCC family protein n=1 Tax=Maribacter sp. 2-571 TaxID=3417569 RepID=UPI003D33B0FD